MTLCRQFENYFKKNNIVFMPSIDCIMQEVYI